MRNLRHSMRTRILAAMGIIAVLGIVLTAAISARTAADQFRAYSSRHMGRREESFVRILEDYYRTTQSWSGAQPLLINLGQATNARLLLADGDGLIVGDSDGSLLGKVMVDQNPASFIDLRNGPHRVGKLYIDPFRQGPLEDAALLRGINRGVLVGAVALGIAALFSAFLVSQTIIRPVQQLTGAVQRMQTGDLGARVDIRSADEVGKLGSAFNQMAANLAHQEELRRNMVSDVAHELRTPLTNIRGYLEAVIDGLLPPDRKLVDNLYEETLLLNRLVNDLHDLAQAESGHLRLERQVQDVPPLLQSAAERSAPQAQARSLTLVVNAPPDLPQVDVDEQRILQVLRNLINNALDYSPAGGQITLSARAAAQNGVNGVQISVADEGPGIAPEKLDAVFERFYRADPSRARSTGGSGLGLAIVRQVVGLHGGRVWAESAPGAGTTLQVWLPAS